MDLKWKGLTEIIGSKECEVMCKQSCRIIFIILCNSTRVSNELGAGNPGRARNAISVTLKLSLFLGLTVVWALSLGHNAWAGFFSDSPKVVEKFASLTPFLVVSITIDSIQGVLSGWDWSLF